jgi:hypothetical protein
MMWNDNALEDFLGEEVVDTEGNPVGTFACYWERQQRSALLLGVDIPERSGGTHIVPARGARFNERQTYVQVLFTRDSIVQAPCLECSCEMDETFEQRVWDFYGLPMPRPVASDLLSQKLEDLDQQLRRVVRRDTPVAQGASSPFACTPPAEEANPPVPGSETPLVPAHRPADASTGEAKEGKKQESSSKDPL